MVINNFGFWEDPITHNKWSKSKYTRAEADRLNLKMQDCTYCTDCVDCTNCHHCSNCKFCENLHHCSDCKYSTNSEYCSHCEKCIDCNHINYGYDCNNSESFSYLYCINNRKKDVKMESYVISNFELGYDVDSNMHFIIYNYLDDRSLTIVDIVTKKIISNAPLSVALEEFENFIEKRKEKYIKDQLDMVYSMISFIRQKIEV